MQTRSDSTAAQSNTAAPTGREETFDTPAVVTIAGSHFLHDLYPSFIGTLLPLLIQKHSMSLAVAGSLVTLTRWPSLAQPFLGYLADRYDARMLVIAAPVVTAFSVSLLGMAPNYTTLIVLLILSGISSATFHPAASAMVTRASGRQWGRATSYFMTGGELSRAAGPIFIATVVAAAGLENSWLAAIPAVALAFVAYSQLAGRNARVKAPPPPSGLREAISTAGRALVILGFVILFRSLVIASFQVFFPSFLTSGGSSLFYAGLALTIYEIGAVVGAFIGGPLSDRFGRKSMMFVSQLTAGPVLFGALTLANQPIGLALLAIGGLLALTAGPVQLTLVQELFPKNRSAASGIMMMLGFEGQVVATIAMGFLADAVGLQSALTWSVLLSMLSLPFTLMLPETRRGVLRTQA